ncbi:LOW QUALITY PROTEIN: hypothetical protein ACHAWF_010490 [Thalassiosira exigua]
MGGAGRGENGRGGGDGGGGKGEGGYARARGWRRTSGLRFCPKVVDGRSEGGFLSLSDRRAIEAVEGTCRERFWARRRASFSQGMEEEFDIFFAERLPFATDVIFGPSVRATRCCAPYSGDGRVRPGKWAFLVFFPSLPCLAGSAFRCTILGLAESVGLQSITEQSVNGESRLLAWPRPRLEGAIIRQEGTVRRSALLLPCMSSASYKLEREKRVALKSTYVYVRTCCSLCVVTILNSEDDSNGYHLKEMEFVLSLKPSTHVLHAYYLVDVYKTSAAHPYGEGLGTYAFDVILNDIDASIDARDGEGLMLDEVKAVILKHLTASLADEQHLCLLHQHALNKPSGRSLRGTKRNYDRPNVAEFYPPHKRNARGRDGKMSEAHVTFTGFVVKVINLSPRPPPPGPGVGRGRDERREHKVGTVAPFESVGTASFPGHAFYLTPTYDEAHQVQRWTVTEDEPILYHTPWRDWATASGKRMLIGWSARGSGRPSSGPAEADQRRLPPGGRGEVRAGPHVVPLGCRAKKDRKRAVAKTMDEDGDNDNAETTATLNLRVLSVAPRVLEARRFLYPAEVNHLVTLATGNRGDVVMAPSTVMESAVSVPRKDKSGGVRGREDSSRTSATGWVNREQDDIVDAIFRRVADLLGIDEGLMRDRAYGHGNNGGDMLPLTHLRVVKAMQLLRYEPGDGYAMHHDFTYLSTNGRYQPRRYATVLLYLTGEGDVVAEDKRGGTVVRKAR